MAFKSAIRNPAKRGTTQGAWQASLPRQRRGLPRQRRGPPSQSCQAGLSDSPRRQSSGHLPRCAATGQSVIGGCRVLGVDTSLRSTGIALIKARGSVYKTLDYALVKNPQGCPLSACLDHLYRAVADILARGKPDVAALEGIFFCKNVKTAVILGEARGVVIAACAAAAVPVYEYSPRRVKQAVVGFGNAGKEQVRKMVMAILHLDEEPHEDAADALAIALCHLHTVGRWDAMTSKAI